MLLFDVNIAVYAYRRDVADADRYAAWLDDLINGDEPFGLSDTVLSGFLRIVTHPKVFTQPTDLADALAFADAVRSSASCSLVRPGPRHWEIFARLCRQTDARGNSIPDAFLAALAIESGCEWVTADRGFSRFPGLRWRHPFD